MKHCLLTFGIFLSSVKPPGVEFQVCAYYYESLFCCGGFFLSTLAITSSPAPQNKRAPVGHYSTGARCFLSVSDGAALPSPGWPWALFPRARLPREEGRGVGVCLPCVCPPAGTCVVVTALPCPARGVPGAGALLTAPCITHVSHRPFFSSQGEYAVTAQRRRDASPGAPSCFTVFYVSWA